MSTDFPTTLDSYTRPSSTDKMNASGVEGDVVIDNLYDAVEACETKLGVTGSAVTTSHDYKLSGVTGTDKAVSKTGTETLTNKTLTTARLNTPNFNEAVNMTSTSTELNVLDGITSSTAELNVTDGGETAEKVLNVQSKARAYLNVDQTNITDTTVTKVLFDTESYDNGSDFSTTNSNFIAPVTGYYYVVVSVTISSVVAAKSYLVMIYVNNVEYTGRRTQSGTNLDWLSLGVEDVVYATAGQAIDGRVYFNCGANTVDIEAGNADTYMSVHLLSV